MYYACLKIFVCEPPAIATDIKMSLNCQCQLTSCVLVVIRFINNKSMEVFCYDVFTYRVVVYNNRDGIFSS